MTTLYCFVIESPQPCGRDNSGNSQRRRHCCCGLLRRRCLLAKTRGKLRRRLRLRLLAKTRGKLRRRLRLLAKMGKPSPLSSRAAVPLPRHREPLFPFPVIARPRERPWRSRTTSDQFGSAVPGAGSVPPCRMGRHKPKKIQGEHRVWLLARAQLGRKTSPHARHWRSWPRRLKVDHRLVWTFVHAEGLNSKNRCRRRAGSPRDRRRRTQWKKLRILRLPSGRPLEGP